MTAPNRQPVAPDVLLRFGRYWDEHLAWGSLHIVLEDDNVDDHHVDFCENWAIDHDDHEGYELALLLKGMSKSQRLGLPGRILALSAKGGA